MDEFEGSGRSNFWQNQKEEVFHDGLNGLSAFSEGYPRSRVDPSGDWVNFVFPPVWARKWHSLAVVLLGPVGLVSVGIGPKAIIAAILYLYIFLHVLDSSFLAFDRARHLPDSPTKAKWSCPVSVDR